MSIKNKNSSNNEEINCLQTSHIIDLMKTIKKSDPLFKPVKKLKTAV